jgi:hypothetical protein
VVRKPKECVICGTLICESCIKCWNETNGKLHSIQKYFILFIEQKGNGVNECPMKCKQTSESKDSILKPIGKVIKNILYNLEVKCPNEGCDKIMTLEKYEDHEYYCYLPKCQNILCGQGSEKLIIVNFI